MILSKLGHLFIRGKAKNHVKRFGSRDLSFSVVALRLNFVQSRAQSLLGFCTVEDDNYLLCSCNNECLWNSSLDKSLGASLFRVFRIDACELVFAFVRSRNRVLLCL